MTTPARIAPQVGAQPALDAAGEAARYALLRRLTPSMRHHLVVNLQPIGMIYEVMDRRLRVPQPDLHEVHDSAQKINGFARAALNSCLDVVTWLAPPADAVIAPADGVSECLGLLATSLTFRGYAVRNEIATLEASVPRSAVRSVLTAVLLHMTDENPPPAEIGLSGQASGDALVLTLNLKPGQGETGFSPEPPYRALTWSDVQAIAASESVEVAREGRQRISLSIPSLRAN